jgi:hypothetical protein
MNSITELIYESIASSQKDHTFGRAKYGEFEVIVMENGYINATKLCALGGKRFEHWLDNNKSKDMISYFESKLGVIKILIKGGSNPEVTGTYVHELLINPIICWISPMFTYFVSTILVKWRKQNESLYWRSVFESLEYASKHKMIEMEHRDIIASNLNGETEVKTPVGFIDILTDDLLIEVKRGSLWKHALGQVLSYGHFYPNHKKVIWLFDYVPNSDTEIIMDSFDIELRIC